jgi:hypothetical protein
MSSDLGVWLAAFATIFIYSYLLGDNPLFKFAEHLYIGIAAAHAVVLGFQNVQEMAWKPLVAGKWIMIIPLVMGLMLYTRFVKDWSSLSRIPIAFLVGLAAALSIRGALDASLIKQVAATMVPVKDFNSFIFPIMVATTISYFFFTAGSKTKGIQFSAQIGRWVMMIAFGSAFGNTIMARMSLVIGRLQFLFGKWILLIK